MSAETDVGGAGAAASQAANAISAFAAFLPWFDSVNRVVEEILSVYEAAEYNKRTCRVLVDRVENVATAVRKLNRRREDEKEKFHNCDYLKTFIKLHKVLKNIKEFINNVSQLKGLSKFLYAKDIKAKCLALIEELETTCRDLQFGIVVSMEDRNLEEKSLSEDVVKMTEFLKTIEGGVIDANNQLKENNEILCNVHTDVGTVKEHTDEIKIKLNAIFEEVIEIKKKVYKREISLGAPHIDINCLEEVIERNSLIERKIFKRLYNGIEVACKRITIPNDDEKWKMTKNRFAILSRLQQSDKIIKFYGFSKYDNGEYLIVFEWAKYGNLRELYERVDIPWKYKIKIAHDICCGLVFLQGCDIFHHDVRCENVMITDNDGYNAKLANFDLSRQRNENSIKIVSISEIIPWLAPEKMGSDPSTNSNANNKKENPYTFKCEVFSYGMLLWELAFQQIPYKNMDTMYICEHVKAGKREHFNFTGKYAGLKEVIAGYSKIIIAAWAHEPAERPSINVFNFELKKLNGLINSVEESNHSEDITDDEGGPFVSDDIPSLIPPLEDGLRAHRDKSKREKAWECFEIHAELGDPVAKYWKGYYLKEGYHRGVKDPVEAVRLFKEAADENVPDAQLHYAFAMLEANNVKEFLSYLNKAVINGNPSALFNYGDLFLNGKLGIKKDEEKGLRYLKMAAVKGQPKALEELKKRSISL
ncbi:4842_t:CDS:2 [Dentiscutata heterogama]|uniref:4842_t:CDS:1 n=1 Tax=Dentiscutata heterogama TaxID=1316150 RepID=A0ACA9L6R9_9GLOM|nr:4842_t:CDS:2 [Dentiscutata heterogama]